MEIIKELKGFSGSQIYLMKDNTKLFVRKIGNVARNYERLSCLSEYEVPRIYNYQNDTLDLEYIHGLDMRKYLETHGIESLRSFVFQTFDRFSNNVIAKDYTEVYHNKLNWVDSRIDLPFTQQELISQLPKTLPSSTYHGDLTLDNILYSNGKFYMIDGIKSEYDSYIFDIAKMRQDLESKWFLRDNTLKIDIKLKNLQSDLFKRYPDSKNDNLLILMLLRILPYTTVNAVSYTHLTLPTNREV